ncbi:hypothetical protein E2C01_090203 [Portunus trituberculatus]|uniref:Uncharacterized protein n=1 Tax=Portunus trituberculatus TaxID=210409 RepID=A0A5B7JAV1_PORTR|nr:hypothetical protein [Portunus trituberculatus]
MTAKFSKKFPYLSADKARFARSGYPLIPGDTGIQVSFPTQILIMNPPLAKRQLEF